VIFHWDIEVLAAWDRYNWGLANVSWPWVKIDYLMADLLHEMSKVLWYSIKQTTYLNYYSPSQYWTQDRQKNELQQEFIRVLKWSNSFDNISIRQDMIDTIDGDLV